VREKVTKQCRKCDWARFVADLLNEQYAQADKIVLVMDNLKRKDLIQGGGRMGIEVIHHQHDLLRLRIWPDEQFVQECVS
jgi:hypothetical protein